MSLPWKVHGKGGEEHGGPPCSRTGSRMVRPVFPSRPPPNKTTHHMGFLFDPCAGMPSFRRVSVSLGPARPSLPIWLRRLSWLRRRPLSAARLWTRSPAGSATALLRSASAPGGGTLFAGSHCTLTKGQCALRQGPPPGRIRVKD